MVENSNCDDLTSEDGHPHDWQSNVVYLNHASEAPLSTKVREAGAEALNLPPWEVNVEDDRQRIRELFASFVNTKASCISIMPSTAFAITLAARNIQVRTN